MKNKCTKKSLKVLGDYWTLSIIQTLNSGEKRFCQLERELPEINPTTLTSRLKKLEQEKLVQRQTETLDKISVVYYLTEKGKGIIPILEEIQKFADRYL